MLNNVPQNGQTLNASKPLINSNFSTIDSAFLVDHVDYGVSGAGKHEQITFVPNASVKAFVAGEMGMFNDNGTGPVRPEIFIQRGISAAYPMTAYQLGGTNAGNGWTYLPSGLKMAWGRSTTGASTNVTLTYATELTNFPGFTTVNNVPQLTRLAGVGATSNFVTLTAYTQTTFQVSSSLATTGTNIQFSWFVIGI